MYIDIKTLNIFVSKANDIYKSNHNVIIRFLQCKCTGDTYAHKHKQPHAHKPSHTNTNRALSLQKFVCVLRVPQRT